MKTQLLCAKCGEDIASSPHVMCVFQKKAKCRGIMCMDCGTDALSSMDGDMSYGICPMCELVLAEELEELGLYFSEDSGVRSTEGQHWQIAFRVSGSDTFKGMCTEAIYEFLESNGGSENV